MSSCYHADTSVILSRWPAVKDSCYYSRGERVATFIKAGSQYDAGRCVSSHEMQRGAGIEQNSILHSQCSVLASGEARLT